MTNKLPRPFDVYTTYPEHVGMDYPYPDDSMVRASGNGRVIFSGYFSERAGYGVTIQYDNGQVHSYKHSDKNDWRLFYGAEVWYGKNIMEIGGTGLGSTGPHLHHEVFVNGVIQKDENYWKYVDKSDGGYVGASSGSGGGDKPFPTVVLESEMYRVRYKGKNGWTYAWVSYDAACTVPYETAVILNHAANDGKNFATLETADAHTLFEQVRSNREKRNDGIADAVTDALDELIADSA